MIFYSDQSNSNTANTRLDDQFDYDNHNAQFESNFGISFERKCCERVTIPRSPDLSKLKTPHKCVLKPYESGALTS